MSLFQIGNNFKTKIKFNRTFDMNTNFTHDRDKLVDAMHGEFKDFIA